MRRARRVLLTALGATLVLVLGVGIAWALDMRAFEGEVVRNATLAGTPVGGLTAAELEPIVAEVERRFADAVVEVETPQGSFEMTAAEIDLRVDRETTIASALAVGRRGPVPARPVEWLRSLVRPRVAPVRIQVGFGGLWEVVTERDPARTLQVTEPRIAIVDGDFVPVGGRAGHGTDPARLFDLLGAAAAGGGNPVVVSIAPSPVPPRYSRADAERLVARARALTSGPLDVAAGSVAAASVPPGAQRGWLVSEPTRRGLELRLDERRVLEDLEALLPEAELEPVEATFTVVNGRGQVIPGRSGLACCADAAVAAVWNALGARQVEPVALPLRIVEPRRSTEDARALGVVEPVASFTTGFTAGQSRVTNIHRIADLVRGVVLEPGDTFSVNEHVGRRTREKGFAPGGAIEAGRFTEAIGGGVSQFATTLFNAAFFAGLELTEYQAHSIYISRYPYGREATLSYPKPDLIITNTTPYGVMLWPTYTPSSITVTIYSTRHLEVSQTGQATSQVGNCTRVSTQRTITNLEDGTSAVDRVFATYRPAEGVNC